MQDAWSALRFLSSPLPPVQIRKISENNGDIYRKSLPSHLCQLGILKKKNRVVEPEARRMSTVRFPVKLPQPVEISKPRANTGDFSRKKLA
jgi:hypothetical protein